MKLDEFMAQFKFNPDLVGRVGVEREAFITDQMGNVVPKSTMFLDRLNGHALGGQIGPELSACQVEARTLPLELPDLRPALVAHRHAMVQTAAKANLGVWFTDLAPENMPLDVYPDPDGRYQAIAESVSTERLRAGCRVAGVHVHIGMRDHETALRVYNHMRKQLNSLLKAAGQADSERMMLYRSMAPHWEPPAFQTWDDVHQHAQETGWEENPRDWWAVVRITIYGTIEVRIMGSTDDDDQIMDHASICHQHCISAM